MLPLRKAWRYQRSNQIPQFGKGQTIQWPKEKEQKIKTMIDSNINYSGQFAIVKLK